MDSIASKPGDHELRSMMNESRRHELWPHAVEFCAGQEAIASDAPCDKTIFEKCGVHVRTHQIHQLQPAAGASRDTRGSFLFEYKTLFGI
jgi:hypothetical protein